MDSLLIAATGAATKEIAKNLINLITPSIDKKLTDYINKTEIKKFKKNLGEYLEELDEKCSYMKTIAFQNIPKKLIDLYEPLTIQETSEKTKIKIDRRTNVFRKYKKILIIDRAGMGKSTLSKRIVLNEIEGQSNIPVFVELRKLESSDIKNHIKSLIGVNESTPDELFKAIPFSFLFDGIDEIKNEYKVDAIKNISDFIDELENQPALVTSRQEVGLSEFTQLTTFTINDLSLEQAISLIGRYDTHNEIKSTLVREIESDKKSIRDFLTTPLYVSLLFCAYKHRTLLPKKIHQFYSQVYDALFEAHDLSKQSNYTRPKLSKLDSEDFHRVLRRFGIKCLLNNGKIEYLSDEIGIEIKKSIGETAGIKATVSDFIKDMTDSVPIFIKEGSTIRWSHKSLMEYFAAMYICHDAKENQKEILGKLFESKKWISYRNTLELCADIDYATFRKAIIKPTLERFLKYAESSYQHRYKRGIKKEDIELRKALTFCNKVLLELMSPTKEQLSELFTPSKVRVNVQKKLEIEFEAEALAIEGISKKLKPNGEILTIVIASTRDSIPITILMNRNAGVNKMTDQRNKSADLKLRPPVNTSLKDNPDDILNNSINFKAMNNLISQDAIAHWITLDTASNELKIIKNEETQVDSELAALLDG